jgi:hypothetical protein
VGVHVCYRPGEFEWMLFKHAYGDFWNILGSIARFSGLFADEEGFGD